MLFWKKTGSNPSTGKWKICKVTCTLHHGGHVHVPCLGDHTASLSQCVYTYTKYVLTPRSSIRFFYAKKGSFALSRRTPGLPGGPVREPCKSLFSDWVGFLLTRLVFLYTIILLMPKGPSGTYRRERTILGPKRTIPVQKTDGKGVTGNNPRRRDLVPGGLAAGFVPADCKDYR